MLVFTQIEETMVVSPSGQYKFYNWKNPVLEYINNAKYIGSIIHNFQHKAMLNFILTETGEDVYRCEINPLSCRDDDMWVMDDQ